MSTVEKRELNKYAPVVSIIQKYKGETHAVVERFRCEVLEKAVDEEQADVVLGTVHAAKGCEWDNVMLLDDCEELLQVQCKKSEEGKPLRWEFMCKPYGDHLNLWYVGLTRAKKIMRYV